MVLVGGEGGGGIKIGRKKNWIQLAEDCLQNKIKQTNKKELKMVLHQLLTFSNF